MKRIPVLLLAPVIYVLSFVQVSTSKAITVQGDGSPTVVNLDKPYPNVFTMPNWGAYFGPPRSHAQRQCVSAGQLFIKDGFRYWNFANSCATSRSVSVCAEYADGAHPVYGGNVPAQGSEDISLGAASLKILKLTWKEGGSIRCPS